jgi:hypothetical protein
MTDDFAATEVLDAVDFRGGDKAVIPSVLSLRQIHEPFIASASGPISLMMQSANEIDFARKDQARAVRHRWGFRPAHNVELNFEIIFLSNAAFPKYSEKRQVRGIAGEQGNLTHIDTSGFNDRLLEDSTLRLLLGTCYQPFQTCKS